MARRPNYGFEKRQKEIKRQKKKDEKAEKKRMKKEEAGGDQDEAVEGGADSGMPEGVASDEDIAELLGD